MSTSKDAFSHPTLHCFSQMNMSDARDKHYGKVSGRTNCTVLPIIAE